MNYVANAKSEVHNTYTRLQGFRLYLAWIILFLILFPAFVVFILTCSIYITDIQRICTTPVCSPGQLTITNTQFLATYHISPHSYALLNIVLLIVYSVLCLLVCGLLLRYKYNDWLGLFAVLLCALSLTCNPTIARFLIFRSDTVVYALRTFAFIQVILIAWFYAFFPSGRFVLSSMRWVLIVYTLLMIGVYLLAALAHLAPVFVLSGSFTLFYCCMACIMTSQVYHYRHVSTPIERQQTKWILFSLTMFFLEEICAYTVAYLLPTSFINLFNSAVELLALALFFLSIVMAILRYRLWDIDIIINRTLVYGTLTLSLVLLYLSMVFVLQSLLNPFTKQSDLAIIGSTLAIALLFQPLRTRIQRTIDRRFYRSKYDAAQTLAAFGASLHEEMDLQELSKQLLVVVSETMQPTHISLWLRQQEQNGGVTPSIQEDDPTGSSAHNKDDQDADKKYAFY